MPEQISKQLKISDKKTFEKAYNQYYKGLVGFAHSFLSDLKAGEDIVQDIFYNIWQKKQQFHNDTSLKVYLYKSTRNRCFNYLRHQNVVNDFSKEQINFLDTEENLMKQIMTEEVYRILYKYINELSDKRREVILLSLKGFTIKEIAQKLDITNDTVKTHKKIVYKILREKMKDHAFILFILLGM